VPAWGSQTKIESLEIVLRKALSADSLHALATGTSVDNMTCRDCAFQSLILKLFILSSLSMDLASREDSQATSAGVWNSSGHCCKIDRS
jgi:hypothetical protein